MNRPLGFLHHHLHVLFIPALPLRLCFEDDHVAQRENRFVRSSLTQIRRWRGHARDILQEEKKTITTSCSLYWEKTNRKTFSLYLKWNAHLTEWDEDEYGDAHQRRDDEKTAHHIGPGTRQVAINHEGMSLCQVIQHRELLDRNNQVGDSMWNKNSGLKRNYRA